MNNLILGLNTTESPIEVCLIKNNCILDSKKWEKKNNESEKVLKIIDDILKENKTKKNELNLIAIVIGEGSYTGTRIGVSLANSLAYGLGIKLIEIKNTDVEIDLASHLKDLNLEKSKLTDVAIPIYSRPPLINSKIEKLENININKPFK